MSNAYNRHISNIYPSITALVIGNKRTETAYFGEHLFIFLFPNVNSKVLFVSFEPDLDPNDPDDLLYSTA